MLGGPIPIPQETVTDKRVLRVGDSLSESGVVRYWACIRCSGWTVEPSGARTLLATRVGRPPVVDGSGRLIGLFSRSDVIRAAWEGRKAGRCEI